MKLIKYLLILIIAVVVVAFLYLNTIFKSKAEEIASRMTGTKVSITLASISPWNGTILIKGLDVGNPQGYQSKNAIEFSSISAKIDTKTIFDQTIHVKTVVLQDPVINYEIGMGGDNIRKLLSNVKSNSGSSKNSVPSEPEASSGSKRKVVIDDLYLYNCKAKLAADVFGLKAGHEFSLNNIHLQDVGSDKGGTSIENVTGMVLGDITKELAKVKFSDLTDGIKGINTDSISKSAKGLKNLF